MLILRRTMLIAGSALLTAAGAPKITWLVFFDWDRTDLNARGRQLIADAAQRMSRDPDIFADTRVHVDGHTDNSGNVPYDNEVSVKRAQAVAFELVRLGLPRSVLSIRGHGSSQPLVPTPPSVREQQNRRVEIWAGDA